MQSAVKAEEAPSSSTMDVDLTPPSNHIKSAQPSRAGSAEPAALGPVRSWDADDDTVKAETTASTLIKSGAEPAAVKMEQGVDGTASALGPGVEAASLTTVKSELGPAEASISTQTPLSLPEAGTPSTPQPAAKKKKTSSSSTATKKESSSSSSTSKPKKASTSTKKSTSSSTSHTPHDTPSSRSKVKPEPASPPPATLTALDAEDDDEDTALYCICQRRQDDVEGGMIMCDRCEQWYHYRCVGITEDDAELVDQFICPPCHGVTGEQTTYKAACARAACRRAAITLFSKYCSDRCGVLAVTGKMAGLKVDKSKAVVDVLRADRRVGAARKTEGLTQRMEGWEGVWRKVVAEQLFDATTGTLGIADAFKMMVQASAEPSPPNGVPNGVAASAVNGASSIPLTAPDTSSATSLISIDEQHTLITQQLSTIDVQKQRLNARLDRLDLRSTLLHLVSDRVPTLAPAGSSSAANAEAAEDDEEMADAPKPKKKKGSKSKSKSTADAASGPRCGYDQRLHWDDATFDAWAHTAPGTHMLAHEAPLDGALDDSPAEDQPKVVCGTPKRKCRRHLDWSNLCELALDAEKASLNADSRMLTQLRLGLVERRERLQVEREAVCELLGKEEERESRRREERDRDVAMRMANEGTRRGGL
ncbi:conserved hypothetical protein [Sporisorium reilianum SRZ2]|uniref:PHD-type domain-containing protein n=1 Tax=Sporisorium reilianum (strain SRZ2) TaxID=999809 RepID=E6ZKK0_SPORE|nr:conserved hypothetical protein [Sporisorium reilianum SRZ2]